MLWGLENLTYIFVIVTVISINYNRALCYGAHAESMCKLNQEEISEK